MVKKNNKKIDPHKSIPPEEISMDGILIDDEFLAAEDLSLTAKVIYLIIRRELLSKHKFYTTRFTDSRLAKMVGNISISTVQRKLKELDEKGYIAIVSQNRCTMRDKKGMPSAIRGRRWIYLDKKLAGHRKRAISKAKTNRPVGLLYSLLVLEKGVPKDVYVNMMRQQEAETKEQLKQEEDDRYFEAFKESLLDLSDEEVLELELQMRETPGAYLKLKQTAAEERDALESITDEDDNLFDDESIVVDLKDDL